MKRIRVNLESISALKPSQYRQFVRGWKPSQDFLTIFRRESKGKSPFRVLISPEQNAINLKSIIPKELMEYLLKNNYNMDLIGYVTGYVNDKYGRKQKLGKVIADHPNLLNPFNSDESRKKDLMELNKESFVVAISHHPYDIAGMSTDRGWTSCTNLLGEYEKSAPMKVQPEIDNKSIIAYLVRRSDININKPVARAIAKKFVSDAGSEKYVIDAVYPDRNPSLINTFQKWLDKNINSGLKKVPNDFSMYTLPFGMYSDGFSDTEIVNGFSETADEEQLLNLFQGIEYLPSYSNMSAFVSAHYNNKKALSKIKNDDMYRSQLITYCLRFLDLFDTNKLNKFIVNLLTDMYDNRYPFEAAVLIAKYLPRRKITILSLDESNKLLDNMFKSREAKDSINYAKLHGGSAINLFKIGLLAFLSYETKPLNCFSRLYANCLNPEDILTPMLDKSFEITKEYGRFLAAAIMAQSPYVDKKKLYIKLFQDPKINFNWADEYSVVLLHRSQPKESKLGVELTIMTNLLNDVNVNVLNVYTDVLIKCIKELESLLSDKTTNVFKYNQRYLQNNLNRLEVLGDIEGLAFLNLVINQCPKVDYWLN
jgi:hypothetical protein